MKDSYFVLKNHKIFQCLNQEEIESLHWVPEYYKAKKGEFFYFGKETIENLYFIKSGRVKLGVKQNNGEILIKDILQSGDIFGQLNLSNLIQKKEFAQALDDNVAVCYFSAKKFGDVVQKMPQLAVTYMLQVNRQSAIIENRLSNLIFQDTRKRLLNFLKLLAEKFGEEHCGQQIQINISITHEEVAQMIASTRQTVSTILSQLSSIGSIYYSRKEIIILDKKILASS